MQGSANAHFKSRFSSEENIFFSMRSPNKSDHSLLDLE